MAEDPVLSNDDPALEAAEWHARLQDEGANTALRAAFAAWLARHPDNQSRYAAVDATWQEARAAAEAREILALRQETLTRVVVGQRRRMWPAGLAAGIAAAFLAGVTWVGIDRTGGWGPVAVVTQAPATANGLYQTRVGERLTVTLPDGSTAVLNTASRLRALYTEGERRLALEAGEALFEVAKGQKRPFVVVAGGQTITAHGTAFDVRLGRESVKVALIEGRVSVRAQAPGARVVEMRAQDVLVAQGQTASVRWVEDLHSLTSWREGILVFDNETLGSAVAEINRYVSRPIVLADPKVAQLRVSGAFRTGDTTAFIEALEMAFPVRVATRSEAGIVLASRG